MRNLIVGWLISKAMQTPFTHLKHADGSYYMKRYWLVPFATHGALLWWRNPLGWLLQRLDIAVRIHNIITEDRDPVLHDHPWDFISYVLHGNYVEARPADFDYPNFYSNGEEVVDTRTRKRGSWAYRRACDRHRIVSISPDVWTLFISGPKRQWWGFYTKQGKIWHRNFATRKGESA